MLLGMSLLASCTTQVHYIEVDHGCLLLPKKQVVSQTDATSTLQGAAQYLQIRKVACNE
ncbi:hypothetical protein [Ignatzschineria cameli]|uniref:hypothetical protein n=1 Tax=Ignatzschineria cameli TaxID=2182793 RepID=UPI0013001964|nr:hypothetical protein [Ignatzschineria cameli]